MRNIPLSLKVLHEKIMSINGRSQLASRPGPLGEFHKQKMVKAGHWRYLGHNIRRTQEWDAELHGAGWRIDGVTKRTITYYGPGNTTDSYERALPPYARKSDAVWDLIDAYIILAKTVIEIEHERGIDSH